jgi:hypothetical protein
VLQDEAVLKARLEQYPAHREERLPEIPVIFRAINKRYYWTEVELKWYVFNVFLFIGLKP